MKDEFISIVSHELRTPLTSIRGSLGLLGGGLLGELPERGRRMLDVAITNTDRLVRLINDILDVERIESGQAPMVKRHVELAELVAQTAEAVQPLASKAGVTLSLETTPVEVDADPDRIVQTITNLLSNAIKFSTPGSTVRVALAAVDGRAHLRVIDTGRGIPTDKLGLIFDRFQQVDASDAREKGGTGLGLAISRTIVQQHGGEIWAESEPGAGATFHVRLPALGVPLRVLPGPQDESRLVLVCDGDASACEALNDILVGRGYRVLCARTGADAVALAVEHRPALVLLDLQMTGTDGWQTLAELKERPETGHIPVIIMSGTDYSGDESVVMKPVDPQALFSEIDRAMVRWARGEVLLLVEDDLDLAAVLIEFFERQGLRPVHARTGAEAITLSRQTSPSLLVLDLMLPEVDGFRVIDWLRQHDRLKDVPIFVYTARDLDETERARVGLQPERLLTKSRVPPEELVDRVVGVIGRVTRLERENASG